MPKKLNTKQTSKLSIENFSTMTTEEREIMTHEELNKKIDGLFKLTERMFITV